MITFGNSVTFYYKPHYESNQTIYRGESYLIYRLKQIEFLNLFHEIHEKRYTFWKHLDYLDLSSI